MQSIKQQMNYFHENTAWKKLNEGQDTSYKKL